MMADQPELTVFIGNIPRDSTNEDIERLCAPHVDRSTISRIVIKLGFAFVFMQGGDPDRLIKALHKTEYCHRTLTAELAKGENRKLSNREKNARPGPTIFIASYDLASTTKDTIDRLCRPFGDLVRIDMKGTYCFAEYANEQMATRALQALHGKEIGGYKLCVEFLAGANRPRSSYDDQVQRERQRDRDRDRDRRDRDRRRSRSRSRSRSRERRDRDRDRRDKDRDRSRDRDRNRDRDRDRDRDSRDSRDKNRRDRDSRDKRRDRSPRGRSSSRSRSPKPSKRSRSDSRSPSPVRGGSSRDKKSRSPSPKSSRQFNDNAASPVRDRSRERKRLREDNNGGGGGGSSSGNGHNAIDENDDFNSSTTTTASSRKPTSRDGANDY